VDAIAPTRTSHPESGVGTAGGADEPRAHPEGDVGRARGDLGSSLERCRGEEASMSRLETRLIPQDVLPFPPTPSASIVGRAMQ
jgi:hypothetical protein